MFKSFMKKETLLNILYSSLINLPTPINISLMWNFGSIIGLFLGIQIFSGLFLSMHYCPNIGMAFSSIVSIDQDVNMGWFFHYMHMNGASMFFLFMYIHIGRGIYYSSFKLVKTWMMGVTIFLLSMAAAFMGYVLPWGQMSFWGATVITNLISAIPYIGNDLVQWIWGGFSINNATLNRFFSIHFILPFLVLIMVIMHLMYLHEYGSSNNLGYSSTFNMIPFHLYFTLKDLLGFMLTMVLFMYIILEIPFNMGDPDNFIEANPMITPVHIKPEWYFLFAYAILRSIPNKLGGVLSLMFSILILYTLPLHKMSIKSMKFFPFSQMMFWSLTMTYLILTWIGGSPVEYPFVIIGQISTFIYFFHFLTFNKILYNQMKIMM